MEEEDDELEARHSRAYFLAEKRRFQFHPTSSSCLFDFDSAEPPLFVRCKFARYPRLLIQCKVNYHVPWTHGTTTVFLCREAILINPLCLVVHARISSWTYWTDAAVSDPDTVPVVLQLTHVYVNSNFHRMVRQTRWNVSGV